MFWPTHFLDCLALILSRQWRGRDAPGAPKPLTSSFLDLDDVKNLSKFQDLHDPTSLDEAELYECLAYLSEMDSYFYLVNSLLNLPNSDDNPLSYLWLRARRNATQS